MRSMAVGASASEKPNFVSAWPVEMWSCVSPRTSGATRIITSCSRVARRSRRSSSSALSATISPTPASSASPSSRSDFALPWSVTMPGATPARRAICSSPPEATSAPIPSSARTRRTAVHGNAFVAKERCTSAATAANASRNSRARARRSSSATMYAGVPNSRASSTRSQPPTSMWPAAFRVVPSGHTWERLWAVAIARRGCHVGVGGLAVSRE